MRRRAKRSKGVVYVIQQSSCANGSNTVSFINRSNLHGRDGVSMECKSVSMKEAHEILELDKHDFDGVFKAECCGSTIGKGNSMYNVNSTCHNGTETLFEACTKCVKKYAWYENNKYE